MYVNCKTCSGGYYIIRDSKFGLFGGCSSYPDCKSTIQLYDLVFKFFVSEGINIYQWKRECFKCKKATNVYSYFLFYELQNLDESFNNSHGLGLGDVKWIDKQLENVIPSVKERFSLQRGYGYIGNTCSHCGVLQGKNYVVDDPHEIMSELFHERNMQMYHFTNLSVENDDTELRSFFYEHFNEE